MFSHRSLHMKPDQTCLSAWAADGADSFGIWLPVGVNARLCWWICVWCHNRWHLKTLTCTNEFSEQRFMDTLKCCICEDYLKNIMFGFMKQFQFLIVHQEWLKTLGWKRDTTHTTWTSVCHWVNITSSSMSGTWTVYDHNMTSPQYIWKRIHI